MKNVGLSIFMLLVIIFFTACAPEIVTPLQSEMATTEVDTIILFDPATFEEVIKIVVSEEEALPGAVYEMDTIITFDADTFEEIVEVVKTRIISTPQKKNIKIKEVNDIELGEDEIYQIDTIITFDPDTYEETIEIVKTKIKSNNNKN